MNILVWIIFGAIAGWIASLIMRTDDQQGGFGNIVVGIAGALIGGFIMSALGNNGITGFNIYSLMVATVGAIILIGVVRVVRR
jgi:uncharacterized membrane protein YeaQ/YmgE (transglycosylase-associated protein family)